MGWRSTILTAATGVLGLGACSLVAVVVMMLGSRRRRRHLPSDRHAPMVPIHFELPMPLRMAVAEGVGVADAVRF